MTIRKFRKRPVVIEALQYLPHTNCNEVAEFTGDDQHCPFGPDATDTNATYAIDTLEGIMQASPGDWIIRGVQGEHYPCKPDIFEKTYEEVVEDENN